MRSRGQVNDDGPEVPSYSEALDLIQLNENDPEEQHASADPGQNEGTGQDIRQTRNSSSQTDDANPNSSQNAEQNQSGHTHTTVDAARGVSHELISEFEKLRADQAQYENLIKKLWRELSIKHDQMEQLSNTQQQREVPKLPDFTGSIGDEKFEIWITRFNEALYRLNSSEKLDALLPRIRGIAADFVFDQLSPEVRSDYHLLVYELRKRFQTFESPRMYQMQYDKRKQKFGEDAHSFASDLKCLYDKAYPGRPRRIRDEDLVRKYFDGLLDEKASAQVEYHKSPTSIDHAVYEVMRYMDIIGRPCPSDQSVETELN